MSNTTEKIATDEYINKMYDSQLNSQKEQLTQNYNQAISDLDATKEQNAQNLQKNLNTTAVESQRAQKNYNEVQNAYGLSSGAMAQARLAQDNQLQADLTTLRAAQQTADAGIERERALLSQQYSSAIAQAQADNDLARAEALYKEAKDAEAQLLAKQEGAAQLMAGVGDYSLLGQLYGLTDEQIAKLTPKSGGDRGPVDPKTDPTQYGETGLTAKDVNGWSAIEWNNFFANIAGISGTKSAQDEFDAFNNAGLIPKDAVAAARDGVTGYGMGWA